MMRSATKAGVALSAALLLLLLASHVQAQLPHQTRRRMTATAVARSNAVATNGATVVADSKATSTGSPSVSIVNAQGSGEGVEVDCKQETGDDEIKYKECIDNKKKEQDKKDDGNSTASTASAASAGNANGSSSGNNTAGGSKVPWETAPRCTKPKDKYTVVFDQGTAAKNGTDRKPWGFEEETKTSCVLKDKDDKPLA